MFPIQKSLAEEGEELKAVIDQAVENQDEQALRLIKIFIENMPVQ